MAFLVVHRPLLLVLLLLELGLFSTGQALKGSKRERLSCDSWRFNVEVDNLRSWKTVPGSCESYVEQYMTGPAYLYDSNGVASAAIDYAASYNLSSKSNDSAYVWIFDIDETSLSNLPYYARHRFGAEAYNDTAFEAWVEKAQAPPLKSSLKLFKKLKSYGFKVFFLTGRSESQRSITELNLKRAGYSGWAGLILRQAQDSGVAAEKYKSSKRKSLEDLGYTIVGNIGDQWSDITGYSTGEHTFKLPNPMYYIG